MVIAMEAIILLFITCMFILPVPDAPPSISQPFDIYTTSVSLMWDPPPLDNRNGDITHYVLGVTDLCSNSRTTTELQPMASPYTVMDLRSYTLYNFTLQAATVNGSGPAYSQTVQTVEDGQ